MATHKVGGEVDAFCTKCRMTLAHTILAMMGTKVARVRCNTCNGDHAFRSAPGSRSTSSGTPRASKAKKTVIGFEQRLEGKDVASARKYSPKETFTLDEVVNHPTFGLGLVSAVRGDKVDIIFKADQKTLVHARGDVGAPPAKPSFRPANVANASPADKPTSEAELEASRDEAKTEETRLEAEEAAPS
jgi:hypothetical protein